MGKDSKISWTRHTFNPWWGCEKVSPGCAHCYGESFAKRIGNAVWGQNAPRRFFGDKHWNEPLKWNKEANQLGERHSVFCSSMADVFEDRRDLDAPRQRLFQLIDDTPHLNWLLLTKRPENIIPLMSIVSNGTMGEHWNFRDHMPNVWIGTTVENQEMADKRIPILLDVPARIRFLSCEPLLEPLDLSAYFGESITPMDVIQPYNFGIDWLIVGGESGPGFRPFDPEWARSLRDQCRKGCVTFHMKQMGGLRPDMMPPIPEDLQIRKWPNC